MVTIKESNSSEHKSFAVLRSALRKDLDERFSNELLSELVETHLKLETLRLKVSKYKVQAISPNNPEYPETVKGLNSYLALVTRWSEDIPLEFERKVDEVITYCNHELDSMLGYPSPFYTYHGEHVDKVGNTIKIKLIDNRPGMPIKGYEQPPYYLEVQFNSDAEPKIYPGPWPIRYCFYHSCLLVLLNKLKSKQIVPSDESGPNDVTLSLSDHAAIYCLIYPSCASSNGDEQKNQLRYLDDNELLNTEKSKANFGRYVRKRGEKHEWDLSKRQLNNRLEQLEKIRSYVADRYKDQLSDLGKQKDYYEEELHENE